MGGNGNEMQLNRDSGLDCIQVGSIFFSLAEQTGDFVCRKKGLGSQTFFLIIAHLSCPLSSCGGERTWGLLRIEKSKINKLK